MLSMNVILFVIFLFCLSFDWMFFCCIAQRSSQKGGRYIFLHFFRVVCSIFLAVMVAATVYDLVIIFIVNTTATVGIMPLVRYVNNLYVIVAVILHQ